MNSLTSVQSEQLQEIGAHLRELRQARAISIEEVAAKTFIPLRLLTALEEGRSEQLPEPIFIQGFIRRYAETLKLDGASFAKNFSTSAPPVEPEPSSYEVSNGSSSNTATLIKEKIAQKLPNISESLPQEVSRTLQLYLVYILLMVTASGGLMYILNRQQTAKIETPKKNSAVAQEVQKTKLSSVQTTQEKPSSVAEKASAKSSTEAKQIQQKPILEAENTQQKPAPKPEEIQKESSSIVKTTQPNPTAVAQPIQQKKAPSVEQKQEIVTQVAQLGLSSLKFPKVAQLGVPIEVTASFNEESWLRVVADGKTQFEGILTKGDRKTWTAKNELLIRAGNAGAVSVSFNQGEPKQLGKRGAVAEEKFTPEQN
ncbi:MAG TPA: RodZ domain-containing protein [Cyanophyceae cyanobacterium]